MGGSRAAWLSVLLVLARSGPAWPALPADAPPLPPPDPGVYDVVTVSTAQELADACWNLTSNQAIVVQPGTYDLAAIPSPPNGVDGRLTVGRYGAPPISNVQIRGATGNPADVVIVGAGMDDDAVPYGIQVFTATDVLVADVSVGEVYYHAVAIEADQGASRVRLYHCRLFDAGQQIVKGNPGPSGGAADVVIEYCDVFLTAGAGSHPELGYCYTNGIDAVRGLRWVVRDNLVRGIYCRDAAELAGPAVLLWQGSADSVVERNTFLDDARGVSLGLVDSSPPDHTGGVVRNNSLRWTPGASYAVDVPVYTASPGSLVLHNTILTRGTYPNAVEVRYADTGVVVQANLMDAGVALRDGAAATVADNIGTAGPAWFTGEPAGDLHLAAGGTAAVDEVDRHPGCTDDFDGTPRDAAAGRADVGADELRRAEADLDGDSRSDLLWRNSTTGDSAVWLMDGATVASAALLPNLAAPWAVAGVGDFDGDSRKDLLWRDPTTGQNALWFMDGASVPATALVTPVASPWAVAATGDLDGDGHEDVVWRDPTTGQDAAWLMQGFFVAEAALLGTVPSPWSLAGAGDLDGDGRSDLVWRNGATGENAAWFMDGTTLLSGALLSPVDGSWAVAGLGDLDGDGKADLVWRDAGAGRSAAWLMDGAAVSSAGLLPAVGSPWTLAGLGDLDGDGRSDLVWRHGADGTNAVWFMNGLSVRSAALTSAVGDGHWTLVAPR